MHENVESNNNKKTENVYTVWKKMKLFQLNLGKNYVFISYDGIFLL